MWQQLITRLEDLHSCKTSNEGLTVKVVDFSDACRSVCVKVRSFAIVDEDDAAMH